MAASGEVEDPSLKEAALEAAPVALLVVDGSGQILFSNPAANRTFGHTSSELQSTLFEALLAPGFRSLFRDELGRLLAPQEGTEREAHHEVLGLRSSRAFPMELSLGKVARLGAAVAIMVAVRDLTAQRRADALQFAADVEALEARERLEAMLEFAPAFILTVNEHGCIDYINRTLPQHDKKEVIGSSWLPYFPKEQHAMMEAALKTVFETGEIQHYEVATPGPDGSLIWFDSQMGPIRTHGATVGAVLVSQDVTERKRAQAELLAGRHMALLGTLAAGVAHEINTPIQFLGDNIAFLRDASRDLLELLDQLAELRRAASEWRPLEQAIIAAVDAEKAADLPYLRANMPAAFDNCIDGLARVRTIVQSLKDFAHPSEERMVAADLNRAVQSCLTIAVNEYKYVADLETHFEELPLVTCHASEINQAVLNIVVNAAHAIEDVVRGTNQKGLITVRTRREGPMAVIAISDTGTGIPESIRSRVFDPFFTTKEVGKGTGQGLAIAWSTVKKRHSGELTFDTEPGKGTTFFIQLPIDGKGSATDARA